jgi:hypothetical protein
VWFAPGRIAAFDGFAERLADAYRPIMTGSLYVALAGAAVGWGGLLWRRVRRRGEAEQALRARWFVLSLILWTALVARMLFISLLDVTGLPVLERYLQVCNPLLIVLALMGLQGMIARVVGRRQARNIHHGDAETGRKAEIATDQRGETRI